ncbi:tRNA (adenosine(37)-N6)-threonylcarbamoyltransferase complex ATPase subunit type 1 TsaE [Fictibacillus nanhaiensis]|uniref:tRNA (adenosine(37)-N6)-threonylcarbamoyltransferase complex ATPase subunit type 1 TsaE n=1 Tax=Fictibacillus nanhaiensis TaxID=742169 RepID=UPI00203C09B3|nr:tRNA (adenosine(37)-N6)-threonylcarbamoyltransferase complex ATPase subunit type 1 TsaE [Fictibacillus nanhaiensis]MCM3733806.1 tRNA (adenosine(37)-N6)-threonylcarbamoyltransferase complex ATPase subunit type 1 TsaE [Fictibacillus nanhaiensis]
MSTYHFKTKSAEETMTFAEKLGTVLEAGDVLTLAGDLGAGKTTFTKGLAKGLGITRTVNSPTFTIIKEYHGRMPLYHMDVYRLEDSDEDLGFEEYFSSDGVCVVEWATFIKDYLPEERLELVISHIGEDEREIQVTPLGERYEERVKEIMQ